MQRKIAWAEMQRKIVRRGPDNPQWQGKGGVDPSKALRRTPEYKIWREAIFARDDWICQVCKKRGGRLHPHHIEPVSVAPEQIYDVTNGLTLCMACHVDLHRGFRPWQFKQEEKMMLDDTETTVEERNHVYAQRDR